MTTEERVKKIIVEHLGVNEADITMTKDFVDHLGADSLDVVELVMACEEEFQIIVPDKELAAINTVQDVVRVIDTLTADKKSLARIGSDVDG